MLRLKNRDGKPSMRRKHPHFLVSVVYTDNQEFSRVYTDIEKAEKFAARQEKSPVVKTARVTRIA